MKKLCLPNLARFGLCAALFACADLSTAQPASPDRPRPDRPPQQRPFAGGARFGGGQPGQLFPLMERVLTEDQRQSLRSAMEAQREQSREIEGKLREARRELMKAGMIDKFDEAAVRAKDPNVLPVCQRADLAMRGTISRGEPYPITKITNP